MNKQVFRRPVAVRLLSKLLCCLWCIMALLAATALAEEVARDEKMRQGLVDIEADMPGDIGVYLKHLGAEKTISHGAEREWYLASLVKVPLAIAVLQSVEAEDLSLQDKITLKESDYVDGSGDLLYQDPGSTFSISTLIEKSLVDSDSTATDILMRLLGEERFNQQIRDSMVESGFNPFTTIIKVRYHAYEELHSGAADLSNTDYVKIRSAGDASARVEAFRKKLAIESDDLQVSTLEEAFQRYYQRGLNAGTLEASGKLLERLVRGELLNPEHTEYLLDYMERITTGERRLQAGLPEETVFAQKTGTQIERACNMGVANPRVLEKAVVIVVCMQDYGDIVHAESAFQQIAELVSEGSWLDKRRTKN